MLAFLMGLGFTSRRRVLGGLVLLAALGLLIAGETILKRSLQGLGFLLYWMICLLLTGTAIVLAWLDACAVRQKGRREARALVERTLGKIQEDVRRQKNRDQHSS